MKKLQARAPSTVTEVERFCWKRVRGNVRLCVIDEMDDERVKSWMTHLLWQVPKEFDYDRYLCSKRGISIQEIKERDPG